MSTLWAGMHGRARAHAANLLVASRPEMALRMGREIRGAGHDDGNGDERPSWEHVLAAVKRVAPPLGFDIVAPFRVGDYNDAAPAGFVLPQFEGAVPAGLQLGILLGNTRRLWPLFVDHVMSQYPRRQGSSSDGGIPCGEVRLQAWTGWCLSFHHTGFVVGKRF